MLSFTAIAAWKKNKVTHYHKIIDISQIYSFCMYMLL